MTLSKDSSLASSSSTRPPGKDPYYLSIVCGQLLCVLNHTQSLGLGITLDSRFFFTFTITFNIIKLTLLIFTDINSLWSALANQPGARPKPFAVRQCPLQNSPLFHVSCWSPVGVWPLIAPIRFPKFIVFGMFSNIPRQPLNDCLFLLWFSAPSCHLSVKVKSDPIPMECSYALLPWDWLPRKMSLFLSKIMS